MTCKKHKLQVDSVASVVAEKGVPAKGIKGSRADDILRGTLRSITFLVLRTLICVVGWDCSCEQLIGVSPLSGCQAQPIKPQVNGATVRVDVGDSIFREAGFEVSDGCYGHYASSRNRINAKPLEALNPYLTPRLLRVEAL